MSLTLSLSLSLSPISPMVVPDNLNVISKMLSLNTRNLSSTYVVRKPDDEENDDASDSPILKTPPGNETDLVSLEMVYDIVMEGTGFRFKISPSYVSPGRTNGVPETPNATI